MTDRSKSYTIESSDETVSIAACITTMHRPGTLEKCLESLSQCRPAPASIVVSDDSSDAAMIAANRALVARFPGVLYVSGPRRGVCANRNNALAALEHAPDYVSFLDDDLLLPVAFFGVAAGFYAALDERERQRTICTGCRDDLLHGPVSLTFRCYFSPSDIPGSATVAAAVFPRRLFDTERWDENIFFGSEDAELSLRATAANFKIVFLPTLTSIHLATNAGVLLGERAGTLTRYELCCEAARLYIGVKRYRSIEPDKLKLIVFLTGYFLHMALYLARNHSLRSFGELVRLSRLGHAWRASTPPAVSRQVA